eukprot:9990434-Alexandrium_andersonii.AAC.1
MPLNTVACTVGSRILPGLGGQTRPDNESGQANAWQCHAFAFQWLLSVGAVEPAGSAAAECCTRSLARSSSPPLPHLHPAMSGVRRLPADIVGASHRCGSALRCRVR